MEQKQGSTIPFFTHISSQVTNRKSPESRVFSAGFWHQAVCRRDLWVFTILVALCVFLSLETDTFLLESNLTNIARYFSWIAVVALGETVVIISGGIDVSVGAVMAFSGIATAFFLQKGTPVWLAMMVGILGGALIGGLNGVLVGYVRLPAFIVTMGTTSITRGVILGLTGGWTLRDLPDNFRAIGHNTTIAGLTIPIPLLVMVGVAVLLYLILNRSVLGSYIYAIGESERALVIAGVNHTRLKILIYTLSGVFAALGGLLMTARIGVASATAAEGYELMIIAAAVVGGASLFGGEGGIFGVLIGSALLQVLHNAMVLSKIAAHWQDAIFGAIILLALLIDYWRKQKLAQEDK